MVFVVLLGEGVQPAGEVLDELGHTGLVLLLKLFHHGTEIHILHLSVDISIGSLHFVGETSGHFLGE